MKSYGIVRKIDELGRVVLPKEFRRSLGISNGDDVEILFHGDSISVRKYEPFCVLCTGKSELSEFEDKFICRKCRERIATMPAKVEEDDE